MIHEIGKPLLSFKGFSKGFILMITNLKQGTKHSWRRLFKYTKVNMTTKNDPSTLYNPYFASNSGQKDVWSLINETAAAAQKESGKSIVNLGQGFFSYNPPDFAINSVEKALSQPQFNQYAPTRGNPNLLNKLSDVYSKAFNREVDTSQIVVTSGANEGMLSVFFGFLEPGDEVIVFEPFFDQYISNIEMPGATVKYVSINYPSKFDNSNVTGDDWEIDWEGLKNAISDKTKIIVLNTPHNPIGKIFTEEELIKLGKLAIEHNIILLSDEVYENLYFTEKFPRPANLDKLPELADRTITVGSAGKSFAATGWRIGWVEGPANLIKYVSAAHTRICFSSTAPLQQAVADAFEEAENNHYFQVTRNEYKKKYEIFTQVFDELKLNYTVAQGGYFLLVNLLKLQIPQDYAFPDDILAKGTEDYKLAYWLIKEIGVVGIPPTEFLKADDKVGNKLEKCLRFAVCKDNEMLEEAVKRFRLLKEYL